MTTRTNSKYLNVLYSFQLLLMLLLVTGTADAASVSLVTDCGIKARIHTPDELSPWLQKIDQGLYLTHPATGRIELLTGVLDSRLSGFVASFVPMDSSYVADALATVHTIRIDLTIDVFILPTPPAEAMSSFARGNVIFLSPGTADIARETVMHLVTHELGHVMTWAYFDNNPAHWDRYMQLRGLDPIANGSSAMHRDRSREILAEDIRYLFGGDEANTNGRIENPTLALPDQVDGLSTELSTTIRGVPSAAVIEVTKAYPNPFNPQTTIEMQLDESSFLMYRNDALLRITDVRGRMVRMIDVGQFENGRVSFVWNGRDDRGESVSSGRYFYQISAGPLQGRGAVTLVR